MFLAPSSRGLGRRPFKPQTRIRIPLGPPKCHFTKNSRTTVKLRARQVLSMGRTTVRGRGSEKSPRSSVRICRNWPNDELECGQEDGGVTNYIPPKLRCGGDGGGRRITLRRNRSGTASRAKSACCDRRYRSRMTTLRYSDANIRRSILAFAPRNVRPWVKYQFQIFRSNRSPLSARARKSSFETDPPWTIVLLAL